MTSQNKTQIGSNSQNTDNIAQDSNKENEITRNRLRDIGLLTALLLSIISFFGGTFGLLNSFFTFISSASQSVNIWRIQFTVNVLNILVSLFTMRFFIKLYKRSSDSFVSIKNANEYKKITDIPDTKNLSLQINDNLKRVKNLEKQYILFITLFAFSLALVYFTIIVNSYIAPETPILTPEYINGELFEKIQFRKITWFDFLINITNFSGAVCVFLAFRVLHDDSLDNDHTSWTFFWLFPFAGSVVYVIITFIFYLAFSLNDVSQRSVTIFLNLSDLAAGLVNGIAMTLLFGRYVSIEQSVRDTSKFDIKRQTFIKNISYKKYISKIIIWVLPFYALAQPLFGSLTISAFGTPQVFQTCVFAICLIGKFFFFIVTFLLIKENIMNLYLHGVVAKVGDFKALEKCLDFDQSKNLPLIET